MHSMSTLDAELGSGKAVCITTTDGAVAAQLRCEMSISGPRITGNSTHNLMHVVE